MDSKRSVASIVAQTLAVLSFLLGTVSIASPYWALWRGAIGSRRDSGYFGLWDACSDNHHFADAGCRPGAAQYRLSIWTLIGGGIASGGLACCGLSAFLGIPIVLMIRRRDKVCLSYKPAVTFRLVFSATSAFLSLVGVALFAIHPHDGFEVEFGWAFYTQIIVIGLEILLTVACTFELIYSRQSGGDPTDYERDPHGANAVTLSNPNFRDIPDGRRQSGRNPGSSGPGRPGARANGHTRPTSLRVENGSHRSSQRGRNAPSPSVAVTSTSGRPYISMSPSTPSIEGSVLNGSIDSDSVAGSVLSNASVGSLVKSPLRSSLKKTRQNGLGISNPAFAGSSPSITSRGSMKKVKIVIEEESTPV